MELKKWLNFMVCESVSIHSHFHFKWISAFVIIDAAKTANFMSSVP